MATTKCDSLLASIKHEFTQQQYSIKIYKNYNLKKAQFETHYQYLFTKDLRFQCTVEQFL